MIRMMSDESREHPVKREQRCRSCDERIDEASEWFPFCSLRCRQADLGAWFSEKYQISREIKDTDLDEAE